MDHLYHALPTFRADDRAAPARATLQLASRLLLSLIFILAALHKLGAREATVAMIDGVGLPFPGFCYGMTVAIELGAGLAVAIGWHARKAAVALALLTLVAGSLFHNQWSDPNHFIHFLKNLGLIGGLMQIAMNGPGALSLKPQSTRRVRRRSSP